MMTPRKALKIVEAIEDTAASYGYDDDHARRTVGYALEQLAANMAEALGVPACECRYGSHDDLYGNKDCPRRELRS